MTTDSYPDEQDDRDSIFLDYSGQVLSLADDDAGLGNLLSCKRMVAEEAGDGTVHLVRLRESLVPSAPPRANRGLWDPILVEAYRRDVTIEKRRLTRVYPELPQPVAIQPIGGRPVNTHVLEFVQRNKSGVVLLGGGVSRCAIMAELAMAFPAKRIAITTATHGQSKTVQAGLRKLKIRCQRFTGTSNPRSAERIVVGQFAALLHRAVEFEKRDILIAYDAREALSVQAQFTLVQSDVCGRLFGFLGAETHLSPLQEDQLAATFGFDQVAVPIHGCCPVAVDSTFVRYAGPSIQAEKIVALKRRGVWKNHLRNQVLARLARALAVGDCETSSRILAVDGACLRLAHPQRVVLLTDSVEHVAALASRLRSWPIGLDRDYIDAGLSAIEQRLLARGVSRRLTVDTMIATPRGLSEIRPGAFDSMIWAGSGSSFPPIPWHHLVCPASAPRRLMLIDVRDRQHPQLRRWSRQRRELYRDVGWMDAGRNPTLARILRFLVQKNSEVSR